MSGNQTSGFDALFELSESAISEHVRDNFVLEGVVCNLGAGLVSRVTDDAAPTSDAADEEDGLGLGDLLGTPTGGVPGPVADALAAATPRFPCFPDDLTFVRTQVELPSGVTVAAGLQTVTVVAAANALDGTASVELRLVVSLETRTTPDGTEVWLDFVDQIEFARASLSLVGREVVFEGDQLTPALQELFRRTVPELLLLPIAAQPGTTDPTVLREAQLFTIDDRAVGDRDALALGFTFGGGTPGDVSGIPRSHVPAGAGAALLLGSPWLCRVIGKVVREEFGLTEEETTGDGCTFSGNRRIEVDGEEADLRRITFTVAEGRIEMDFHLHVEAGCKEADIIAGFDLTLNVSGGSLDLDVTVHDPVVNESTNGWCVLGSILAGALLGGLIGGGIGGWWGAIIGVVVGAIVGLVVYLVVDYLTDPIGNLPEEITDAIRGTLDSSPQVSVPSIGIVPVTAWIDDVGIGFRTHSGTAYPIRSTGTAVVRVGQGFDLDRAAVTDAGAPGVDLVPEPVEYAYEVRFGPFRTRYRGWLASLTTICGAAIGMSDEWEFAHVNRLEAQRVPVRVNRTIPPGAVTLDTVVTPGLHPSRRVAVVHTNEGRVGLVRVTAASADAVTLEYQVWESIHGACEIVGGFPCTNVLDGGIEAGWVLEKAPRGGPGSGYRFRSQRPRVQSRTGRFRVVHARPTSIRGIQWSLDGVPLDPVNTAVTVDGRSVEYSLDRAAMELTLRIPDLRTFDGWLEVEVDTGDVPSRAGRCVDWESRCTDPVYELPPVAVWLAELGPRVRPVEVEDDDDPPAIVFGKGTTASWDRPPRAATTGA